MNSILITGGAGFIGSNLADTFLEMGYKVIAVDNFDDYYDIKLKHQNIARALLHDNYRFIETDISNTSGLKKALPSDLSAIIHLAAKAGVRSSIANPEAFGRHNTESITHALNLAVEMNISKFIFTSSSSIYGNAKHVPFNEDQEVLIPLNPYAISKLQSEQIGRDFSKKQGLQFISLRLFSVYGPRLRPDLVMSKIAHCLFSGQPLKVFGNGSVMRDLTHVTDIINGIIQSLDYTEKGFSVFNLGKGKPVSLLDVIGKFEKISGKKIKREFSPAIKGESDITWADNTKAKQLLHFNPNISLDNGIVDFLNWYSEVHRLN